MRVEGANDNGTALLRFRRGAFEAGRPVRPCFLKFNKCGVINPTYDTMRFLDLLVFMISSLSMYHSTLNILPPFIPNKFMYDKYAGVEGEEKWCAFACAARKMLCK